MLIVKKLIIFLVAVQFIQLPANAEKPKGVQKELLKLFKIKDTDTALPMGKIPEGSVTPVDTNNLVKISSIYPVARKLMDDLKKGNYAEMQKVFEKYLDNKILTVNGNYALMRIYNVILEDVNILEDLNKWCESEKACHAAFYLRGRWHSDKVWRVRYNTLNVQDDGLEITSNHIAQAKQDLSKAYQMNPKDPHAAASMVTLLGGPGDPSSEHMTWFNRAIKDDPSFAYAYEKMIWTMCKRWNVDTEDCLQFINDAIAKNPENKNMQSSKEKCYRYNQYDELCDEDSAVAKDAERVLIEYAQQYPLSTMAYRHLSYNKRCQWELEKALEYINKAIEIDPTSGCLADRGYIYYKMDNYNAAITDFEKALTKNPNEYMALTYMGSTLYHGLDKPAEALPYYTRALERRPARHSNLCNRGRCLCSLRKYKEAKPDLEMAVITDPSCYKSWYRLGSCERYGFRDYDKAIECYSKAVKLAPHKHLYVARRASCYMYMHKYKEAKPDLEKALELRPNDHESLYDLGRVAQFGMKDYKKAVEYFNKAIDLKPDNSKYLRRRGSAFFYMDRNEEAQQDLNSSIAKDPESYAAWYDLGKVEFYGLKNYDRALECFEKALEINPKYYNAYWQCGFVYAAMEDVDKALESFNKFLKVHPDDTEALVARGIALWKKGNKEKAMLDFERIFEINPNMSERVEAVLQELNEQKKKRPAFGNNN